MMFGVGFKHGFAFTLLVASIVISGYCATFSVDIGSTWYLGDAGDYSTTGPYTVSSTPITTVPVSM